MTEIYLLLAGLFLPLFPFSMLFNSVFAKVKNPYLRNFILILWPQIGIYLVSLNQLNLPGWVATWGLLTALLYGFRLLTIRDVSLWISFLATSAWALLWVALEFSGADSPVYLYALGFSLPLALLVLLSDELKQRFGAAYVGLYGGLAMSHPRFSGILVMVVLAVIATPVFPGFFAMIQTIISVAPISLPIAISSGVVWLLWSWAAALMLQGLIVGPASQKDIPDFSVPQAWKYSGALVGLIIFNLIFVGGLP